MRATLRLPPTVWPPAGLGPVSAMSDRTSLVSTLRRLLSRPDSAFVATLDGVADDQAPVAVWQHVVRFAWRVGDLSLDELRELHDETFGPAPGTAPGVTSATEERLRAVLGTRLTAPPLSVDAAQLQDGLARLERACVAATRADEGRLSSEVLAIVARLGPPLEAAHNPYHHLLVALETLLVPAGGPG